MNHRNHPYHRTWNFLTSLGTITVLGASVGADNIRAVAADIGITPESLIAANLQDEAGTILSRIEAATSMRATYELQQAAANAAAEALSNANAALQQSAGDDTATGAYETASAAYDNARGAVTQTREALRAVALDSSSAPGALTLAIWTQSDGRQVPASFKVNARTGEQWAAIEAALRMEARSLMREEAVEPEVAALLALVREEPAVAAAAARLESDAALVETIFSEFSQ